MQFADFVGTEVLLLVTGLSKDSHRVYQRVKLHGVEAGGLWIESQTLTNSILQTLGIPSAPKTLVLFVPFHQILGGVAGAEGPSLDEKAFGV